MLCYTVKQLQNWLEIGNNFEIFDRLQEVIEAFKDYIYTNNLDELKKLSKTQKELLAELSIKSCVQVLPGNIKEVLEEVEDSLTDVVFSSVPGAGGYDAFYFIVNKPSWNEARDYVLSKFPNLMILDVR